MSTLLNDLMAEAYDAAALLGGAEELMHMCERKSSPASEALSVLLPLAHAKVRDLAERLDRADVAAARPRGDLDELRRVADGLRLRGWSADELATCLRDAEAA